MIAYSVINTSKDDDDHIVIGRTILGNKSFGFLFYIFTGARSHLTEVGKVRVTDTQK